MYKEKKEAFKVRKSTRRNDEPKPEDIEDSEELDDKSSELDFEEAGE